MRITCKCGHETYIHKAYQPSLGESEPWICPRCKKEWELFGGRRGVSLHEVRKDKKEP